MNDDAKFYLFLALVVIFLGGLFELGFFIAHERHHKTKVEAIKRGFATWVSDEDGRTTFTWKEVPSEHTEN